MILLMPSTFPIDFTGNHQLDRIPVKLKWGGGVCVNVTIRGSSGARAKGTGEVLSCLG